MIPIFFIVTAIIVYFGGKSDARRMIQKQIEKDGKIFIGNEVYNCTKIDKVGK